MGKLIRVLGWSVSLFSILYLLDSLINIAQLPIKNLQVSGNPTFLFWFYLFLAIGNVTSLIGVALSDSKKYELSPQYWYMWGFSVIIRIGLIVIFSLVSSPIYESFITKLQGLK